MGLSAATLNAIQRAQRAQGVNLVGESIDAFGKAYKKAYTERVEKLAKENEQLEENKIKSLDVLEELSLLGTKLGKFGPEGEKILRMAKDEIYSTYDLKSQFDQTVKQREILQRVRKELEPFAETNQYIQGLIKSNTTQSLDRSMMAMTNFAGSGFNKYEVLQALGANHEVVDKNTISTKIGDTTINIPIADLKTSDYKISNIDSKLQESYLDAENQFVRDARQSNFTNAQVKNMVDQYVLELNQDQKTNLTYNFFSQDEMDQTIDSESKDIYGDIIRKRMTERISGRYAYESPKVEEDESRDFEDFYNQSINTINELPDTIGPFTGGNYYLSSNFEDNLPEGYQSSGAFDEDGDLIIENINNRKQVLIKENEPLPAVKAKLRSIASSREKFFRDNN